MAVRAAVGLREVGAEELEVRARLHLVGAEEEGPGEARVVTPVLLVVEDERAGPGQGEGRRPARMAVVEKRDLEHCLRDEPGHHGAHIHEKADCSAPDAKSAGDHLYLRYSF